MPKRSHETESAEGAADLFKKEMAGVRRLQHKQAPIKSVRPSPPRQPRPIDDITEAVDVLRFLRPGIQAIALKRLRRGQFPNEGTLDLHGFTSAEAAVHLQRFIHDAKARGKRAVRIVHGKGHGSANEPVLKSKVNQWLKEFADVLAFCSAQPQNGGTGAVDVLLRK